VPRKKKEKYLGDILSEGVSGTVLEKLSRQGLEEQ